MSSSHVWFLSSQSIMQMKSKSYYKGVTDFHRPTGMRKTVAQYPVVKPKVERLQLQHGVTPEDLKDFVGPRHFLTKFKGVKQQKADEKLAHERIEDRKKRTFTQAGISVITSEGEKTLTVQNAQKFKAAINAEKLAKTQGRAYSDIQINAEE